jgi:hypothetical protein
MARPPFGIFGLTFETYQLKRARTWMVRGLLLKAKLGLLKFALPALA